ncbi:MAG: membrane dipeptidase [Chloroflexi bacterium]|nr:membrane dipeptidase [Chloroflexota bacterium]
MKPTKRHSQLAKEFVGAPDLRRIGLRPGYRVGHLDGTANYVADHRFDRGPFDRLHRELTVVDAYSALVDIEELLRGRINVVIQALGPEELFVQEELQNPSEEPPKGVRSWLPVFEGDELVERIKVGIDEHLRFAEAHADYIEVALTEPDIPRIVADERIGMVLMLVSGYIADNLDVLKEFHELGIRVMCPSHLAATSWADSSAELNDIPGLTDFGRDVIRTCNEIGVLVDLAHCSDYSCRDSLAVTKRPVIATHTKVRAITGSLRDMSDDVIRGVADTGGVVCVLAATPRTAEERHDARLKRDRDLLARYSDPFDLAEAKLADAQIWSTKLDLKSIDYAVNVAGIDHVGLSSHAQNVPQWKEFTETLLRHGFTEEETSKILGENVQRILRETL